MQRACRAQPVGGGHCSASTMRLSLGRRLFVKALVSCGRQRALSSTLRRFAGTRHSERLAYTATATVVSGCQPGTGVVVCRQRGRPPVPVPGTGRGKIVKAFAHACIRLLRHRCVLPDPSLLGLTCIGLLSVLPFDIAIHARRQPSLHCNLLPLTFPSHPPPLAQRAALSSISAATATTTVALRAANHASKRRNRWHCSCVSSHKPLLI